MILRSSDTERRCRYSRSQGHLLPHVFQVLVVGLIHLSPTSDPRQHALAGGIRVNLVPELLENHRLLGPGSHEIHFARSTFRSWGSSSNLYFRRTPPIGVIRGSFSAAHTWGAVPSHTYIVRNL